MKNLFKRSQQTIEQARNKRVSELFTLLKSDVERLIWDKEIQFSPEDHVLIVNQLKALLQCSLMNDFSDCHTEINRLKIKSENIEEAIAKLK